MGESPCLQGQPTALGIGEAQPLAAEHLPEGIPGSTSRYAIRVRNPAGSAACVRRVVVDGVAVAPDEGAAVIDVVRDGARHEVEVELGPDLQ